MDSILNKQCSAMWRLAEDGTWKMLHAADQAEAEAMSGVLELFASTCWQTYAVGSKFSASLGGSLVAGRVDQDGVLVGYHADGGNPVMLRTAMDRLITRSRADSVDARSQHAPRKSQPLERSEADDREVRGRESIRPHGVQNELLPDERAHVSTRTPSTRTALEDSKTSRDSRPIDTSRDVHGPETGRGSHHVGQADHSQGSQQRTDEDVSGVEFEIVFSDPSNSTDELAESEQEDASYTACTWGEVANHVEGLMEDSAGFVGRVVAANYWRDAIEQSDAVSDRLRVDALGRLEVRSPEKPVEPEQARQLTDVQSAWVSRCTRVIPDITNSLPRLGQEPWIQVGEYGGNR